jgi:molybdopterin molybdotransferase
LVVARRPVFAVMATGDELAIRGRPGPPPVRESTSHAVCAWLRRAGALPRLMPALPDDLGTTAEALSVAARGADAIVTIGGVGPGDHDHVRPALRWLDAELETEGVAIRPGRPFSAGRLGEIPVLCLPGTPGAAMLTCVLFAVPLARAMQGDRSPVSRRTPLRIVGSHVQHTRHEELLRARLELHDEELCAILMPEQASASIAGFAEADALVFVAPARKGIRNGERHPVMRLADV